MYRKINCMGFSFFRKPNFKGFLLQRVKHIIKFMCVCMVLVVPLNKKENLKGIFFTQVKNFKKLLTFHLLKAWKQMYLKQSVFSATRNSVQILVKYFRNLYV